MDGHTTVTKIHAHSDSSNVEQPVTSVAFLSRMFFINSDSQSAYLDTTSIKHICNWPYVDTDPAFFDTSIEASGVVCRLLYELHDESIVFPVKVSVYILNDIKSFRVMYDHFAGIPFSHSTTYIGVLIRSNTLTSSAPLFHAQEPKSSSLARLPKCYRRKYLQCS
jgi:hypothetical protein